MYRKILVAFDGSPESRLAVDECSHLMQVSGREIHLVCVLHDPSPYLLAGEFVSSVGVMVFDVNQNSLIAMLVPNQMRSRVAGVMRFFNYGVRPIGALLGGLLGGWIGLRPTMWISVVGSLLGVLFLLASPTPGLREETIEVPA